MPYDNTTEINVVVYVEDTDVFGVVYHPAYLRYYDRGRTEWLKHRRRSLQSLVDEGYALVVHQVQLTYRHPAVLGDRLLIRTQLQRVRMSVAVFRQTTVIEADNRLINEAEISVVALDRERDLCHISPLLFAGSH